LLQLSVPGKQLVVVERELPVMGANVGKLSILKKGTYYLQVEALTVVVGSVALRKQRQQQQ